MSTSEYIARVQFVAKFATENQRERFLAAAAPALVQRELRQRFGIKPRIMIPAEPIAVKHKGAQRQYVLFGELVHKCSKNNGRTDLELQLTAVMRRFFKAYQFPRFEAIELLPETVTEEPMPKSPLPTGGWVELEDDGDVEVEPEDEFGS